MKSVEKERLREFLLEHLVPGEALHTFNEEDVYGNCNKRPIAFKYVDKDNESQWTLNGFKILRTAILNEKSSVIYIDGILGDRKATTFSKRNIQETNKWVNTRRWSSRILFLQWNYQLQIQWASAFGMEKCDQRRTNSAAKGAQIQRPDDIFGRHEEWHQSFPALLNQEQFDTSFRRW